MTAKTQYIAIYIETFDDDGKIEPVREEAARLPLARLLTADGEALEAFAKEVADGFVRGVRLGREQQVRAAKKILANTVAIPVTPIASEPAHPIAKELLDEAREQEHVHEHNKYEAKKHHKGCNHKTGCVRGWAPYECPVLCVNGGDS